MHLTVQSVFACTQDLTIQLIKDKTVDVIFTKPLRFVTDLEFKLKKYPQTDTGLQLDYLGCAECTLACIAQ